MELATSGLLKYILLCITTFLLQTVEVWAVQAFTVERYLEQVKKENPAYRSYLQTSRGSLMRSEEGRLVITPSVFAHVGYSDDRAYPTIALPGFNFASLQTSSISTGISQNFSFGLGAKFSYNFYSTNYVNLAPLWRIVQPKLDLTYPLWAGGFGRSTRARAQAAEAQGLASHYGNRFQSKLVLQEAELNYWKLAVTRQVVELQKKGIGIAERLAQWNASRVSRHLADKADSLQSQGFLAMKRLDLESATNDLRIYAQAFNASRNINSPEVNEVLPEITPDFIADTTVKLVKPEERDDIQSTREQIRATQAGVIQAAESARPKLDLVMSGWLNGRDNGSSNGITAWDDQFAANRPSWSAMVQFSMPLDLGARYHTVEGYTLERDAAETLLQKKYFDAEQTYLDLTRRLGEAKKRLVLAREAEAIQTERAKNERLRLQSARSTTFLVVQADSDQSNAQLMRLRVQLEILSLMSQLKLYN